MWIWWSAVQMVESGSKGAILMVAKEHINSTMLDAGSSPSAPLPHVQ